MSTPEYYAVKIVGPGHVIVSRRPEDVQAAWLEELRPAIEAAAHAYALARWDWAWPRRHRSRVVTRRKQRRTW